MQALPLIIQGILAAIQAAPQVEEVVTNAKNFISSLVTAKIITTDIQNALHAYVDAHAALLKAGVTPPAWTVEPNPS